jgi:hypothetical protein
MYSSGAMSTATSGAAPGEGQPRPACCIDLGSGGMDRGRSALSVKVARGGGGGPESDRTLLGELAAASGWRHGGPDRGSEKHPAACSSVRW